MQNFCLLVSKQNLPGVSICTKAGPSMTLASNSGDSMTGSPYGYRQLRRSDLVPWRSFPPVDKDGGYDRFSFWKKSSRFPSRDWQLMYICENIAQSFPRRTKSSFDLLCDFDFGRALKRLFLGLLIVSVIDVWLLFNRKCTKRFYCCYPTGKWNDKVFRNSI